MSLLTRWWANVPPLDAYVVALALVMILALVRMAAMRKIAIARAHIPIACVSRSNSASPWPVNGSEESRSGKNADQIGIADP